jgi:hypothetical protein
MSMRADTIAVRTSTYGRCRGQIPIATVLLFRSLPVLVSVPVAVLVLCNKQVQLKECAKTQYSGAGVLAFKSTGVLPIVERRRRNTGRIQNTTSTGVPIQLMVHHLYNCTVCPSGSQSQCESKESNSQELESWGSQRELHKITGFSSSILQKFIS